MAGTSQTAHWSSRWTFIMAAVGSAVGLGNIWKFPYEAGQGGGGAFVLIYLFFVFVIGTPVLVAELSLGRRGQKSPIGSMAKIAKEEGRSPLWSLIGWSGVLGAVIVLSFYSVIGGWTLSYMFDAFAGTFSGMDAAAAGAHFGGLLTNEYAVIGWHAAFMGLTMFIVARGVEGGLEKAVTYLMPALFALLIGLAIYSSIAGDLAATVDFLFKPDFSKLTFDVMLQALGQSFFSLSLALGSIMTYGAYMTRDVNIGKSAVIIASADTGVAIMAGMMIFPIVFAYGLVPGQGPGLIFATLPIAFGQMSGGAFIGGAFFFLLVVAAITSSISLLEPSVSYITEKTGANRRKVALMIGGFIFTMGILSGLSQGDNPVADISIFGRSILDAKDFLTNNIMMPIGGMFSAIFVGWFVSRKNMMEELAMEDGTFRIWYFLVRFICPVAIGAVFVSIIYNTVTG
nr:sodium-dependent transporter [Kordiimonas aquimaris]